MSRTLPLAKAKARFSEVVREAETGRAVLLTRHGRPVVAVVPATDLAQIERLRAVGPEGGLAGLAGGWKGSEKLVEAIESVRRTRSRRSPRLR